MKRTPKPYPLGEIIACEHESGNTHRRQRKRVISLLHKQLHKTRNALLRWWVTSWGGISETETEVYS